jgi:hypothetical protein
VARQLKMTYLPAAAGAAYRVRVNVYTGVVERPILDGDERPVYEPVLHAAADKRSN